MQFERVWVVILKSVFSLILMFGAFVALIVFGAVMKWHCSPWDYIQPAFFWIALLSLASLLMKWIASPTEYQQVKAEAPSEDKAQGPTE